MTLPLTERQERLWRFIRSCDRSPSVDEMTRALGDKVKGAGVVRTIEALEDKGFVSRGRRFRGRHRARSIVALDPTVELSQAKTSDLIAELERRGVLLDCAA